MLPMTLSNMNNLKFTPRKDYTANRLVSGILQLSDGTQLILNETALQPGQLDANGDFFNVNSRRLIFVLWY